MPLLHYTKVIPQGRLKDRFVTLQVVEPDPGKKAMGALINLVEITRPWYPSAQIGQSLIAALVRTYYKQTSTSNLENFERALKTVNETLLRITEEGETDWLGHFHAVLGLVVDQDVHLSITGQARVILAHRQKFKEIFNAEPDLERHPKDTFSQILSGTLAVQDKLVIGSSSLLSIIPFEEIQLLVHERTPYQSALAIAQRIKAFRSINAIAGVFEIAPSEAPQTEPNVVYLDQPNFFTPTIKSWRPAIHQLGQTLGPAINQLRDRLAIGLIKAWQLSKNQLWPKTRALVQKTAHQTIALVQAASQQLAPYSKKNWQSAKAWFKKVFPTTPKPTITHRDQLKDTGESLIGKSIFTVHDYTQSQDSKTLDRWWLKPIKILQSIGRSILRIIRRLISQPNLILKRRNLLIFLATIALSLLLIGSVAIERRRQTASKSLKNQEQLLKAAEVSLGEAKTALIFGDRRTAASKFNEAIQSAAKLRQSDRLSEKAQSILSEATKEFDKLTNTTRFVNLNPSVIYPTDVASLWITENKAYSLNRKTDEILGALLVGGSASNVLTIPETTKLEPVGDDLATTQLDNAVYLLTNDELILINLSQKTSAKVQRTEGATLNPAVAINHFADALYFLDSTNNQIWRYKFDQQILQKPSPFFNESQQKSVDLKSATSLAVDGSIWVLKKDGKIEKYNRGRQIEFNLKEVPGELSQPLKIWTDDSTDSLFIVLNDPARIIEINKASGKYLQQYIFDGLNSLDEVVIKPSDNKIWGLSENKVYEVNF